MVHRVAGAGLDRAHDRRRATRRVRARPLPVQGPERRERARRRALRTPDRRRRARLPRNPPGRRRARLGADPRRPRVLQRRRRRAHRRNVLGESRPAARRGGSNARRSAARALPHSHRPAPGAGAGGCGGDRLPLLVHFFRRRPHSRWPALRDDRGRDLQPGRPSVRPACGGRPFHRAAGVRRCCRVGRGAARTATRGGRRAQTRGRDASPAPHGPGQARRGSEPRRTCSLSRAAARRPRRALARSGGRLRA